MRSSPRRFAVEEHLVEQRNATALRHDAGLDLGQLGACAGLHEGYADRVVAITGLDVLGVDQLRPLLGVPLLDGRQFLGAWTRQAQCPAFSGCSRTSWVGQCVVHRLAERLDDLGRCS